MAVTRTEIVRDFGSLLELTTEWDRLWGATHCRTIFTSPAWARASWQAYGSKRSLYTPVMFRDNAVVGILPLSIAQGELGFLCSPRSDYNDLVSSPAGAGEILEAAFQAILAPPLPWYRCVLDNIPEGATILAHFHDVTGTLRSRLHLSVRDVCTSVDLSIDRERVLAQILGRKSVTRDEKRLKRLGQLRFRHLSDREEIRSHLPTFFRQHIARRAMLGERSLFCEQETRAFYEELVAEFNPENELRFSVLEVSGRPIAYHLGFEVDDVFLFYKPTFDIDLWDYSPGKILTAKLFEYVAKRSIRKFDFTVGGEEYKSLFVNQTAYNYSVVAFPPTMRGRVGRLALRAKDGLKRHTGVFSRAKRAVAGARTLCARTISAVKRNGVLGQIRRSAGGLWTNAVLRRDVILVFAGDGMQESPPNAHLDVRTGSLGELACLATQHSDVFTPNELGRARDRLRKGDKVYMVREGGECVHVAWTRIASEIIASEAGSQCRVELERPAVVVYDCWTPAAMRGQSIYPNVLRVLAAMEATDGRQVWVYCQRENRNSLRGITKAGFSLKYRMQRTRLFGCWSMSRVISESDRSSDTL